MSLPPSGRRSTRSDDSSTPSQHSTHTDSPSSPISSSWFLINDPSADDPTTTYPESSYVVVTDLTDKPDDGYIFLRGRSRMSVQRTEQGNDDTTPSIINTTTTMARNDGTFEATSSRSSRRQQAVTAQYGSASAASQTTDAWAETPAGRWRHRGDGLERETSDSMLPTVDSFGSTRKDSGGGGGGASGCGGPSGGGTGAGAAAGAGGGGGGASASGSGSSSSAARATGSGLTEDNVRRTSGFYEDLRRERDRAERAGETREPSTRREAVARVVERAEEADKASRERK